MMESLKNMQTSEVAVIRGGINKRVNIVELVKGDVVVIKTGDKIPADCRIFVSNGMEVDNSALTGESRPVKIGVEPGEKGIKNSLEAVNLAYYSTLCGKGEAVGVVIAIGPNTFMGTIADLASSAVQEITTLQKELNEFIHLIAIIAVSLGIIFFILGCIIKYPIITNFIFAIGIIVANVPEGLGYAVTSILAIVAQKMLKRNIFIKNLQSVETLGSITCICSDKTGTLTQNKMLVVHLWYDMEIKRVKSDQEMIRVDGKDIIMKDYDTNEPSFEKLQFVGVCGSKGSFLTEIAQDFLPFIAAKKTIENIPRGPQYDEALEKIKEKIRPEWDLFYNENINDRQTNTDASESAILKFFENVENIDRIRERNPIHKYNNAPIFIPFDSKLKFAFFLRDIEKDGKKILSIAFKGAPEQLIDRCNKYLYHGKEVKMNQTFLNEFKTANKTFALKGERVIGFAYSDLDPSIYNDSYPFSITTVGDDLKVNFPIEDLTFCGLMAMEDPPRPGVKEAIKVCHEAGVKVIMVTGDQPLTAASIAYQIGIIKDLDDTPEIIKDREGLPTLEDAEKKSNTIIIAGPRITQMIKEEEGLSEDNPKKGAQLRSWLMKRDVVFARTSPQQKLVIVDGCQKLSHCVAVTGDGVNDSPAMKKADIGVAMGKSGTDVAKDAADILLLDDNFANIVKGIKQGRVVFDILKKIIRYNICSNVAELWPFIGFVILAFPLPLTTLQLLCMDVGTNIYPNICFAYEIAEDNIMNRKPRNVKTDRLCPLILFSYCYLFIGTFQTAGNFLMYFGTANMYGIPPLSLLGMANSYGIGMAPQDTFNPYDAAYNGNTNAFNSDYSGILGLNGDAYNVLVAPNARQLDLTSNSDSTQDFRLFFSNLPASNWVHCNSDSIGQSFSEPVCYKVEAIRHAQGAYLLGHVIMQIINGISSRVKISSVLHHQFKNMPLNIGYFIEIGVICLVIYIPGFNTAFQVRALVFENWIPALGQFIIFFFYDELIRLLLRNIKHPDGSPGFFYEFFNY